MEPAEFINYRGRLVDPVVFINYRGADSHGYGALLYTALVHEFGKDLVFLDAESIPAGADFPTVLLDQVRSARVLLAVIGRWWWSTIDPATGRRLIDDPADWVRRELAEAFAAGVRVIPVLTDGAELPREEWLTPDIAALSRCQYRYLHRREPFMDLARIIDDLTSLDPTLAAAARKRNGDDSNLELSATTFTEDDDGRAVLDLKFRNVGGQPAFLHRASIHVHDAVGLSLGYMRFLPYEDGLGPAAGHHDVSYTYDLALPHPKRAAGSDTEMYLSQFVEPSGVDRFHIRLGNLSRCAYVLHFDIYYDAHRVLTSPTIAVGRHIGDIEDIRSDLRHFRDSVREVRDAIDRELIARGLPAVDWNNHPPSSRADLPPNLRSVDGDPAGPDREFGMYAVNDAFWDPRTALIQRLRDIHSYHARLISITTNAMTDADTDNTVPQVLTQAQTILAELPALYADL